MRMDLVTQSRNPATSKFRGLLAYFSRRNFSPQTCATFFGVFPVVGSIIDSSMVLASSDWCAWCSCVSMKKPFRVCDVGKIA